MKDKIKKVILILAILIVPFGVFFIFLLKRKKSLPTQTDGKIITPLPNNYPKTRGFKNNNPFNIRNTNIDWNGEIPMQSRSEKDFEVFDTIENGIRAGLINLRTIMFNSKFDLSTIIHTYAPPFENNTDSYISHVKQFGVPDKLNIGHLPLLAKAISLHENGHALTDADINKQMIKLNG